LGDDGKRLAKEVARPLLRPLLARLAYLRERTDALGMQLQALEATTGSRLPEVERQMQTAQNTLNELLDAITVQNALARETRREQIRIEADRVKKLRETWDTQSQFAEALARLEHRLEFIRREVMVEVRYGHQEPGAVAADDPNILNAAKLRSQPIRLNLGCGHVVMEEYVNIDGRPLPGVDVVADVGNLPLEQGSVDEIRSSHLLEHFPFPRLSGLLQYWFGLLRPGGGFIAVVPDAEAMIRAFMTGDTSWGDLKEVTYGAQEYAGDFHFTMFSQDDLVEALASAGFVDVKVVAAGRRNGACLEMEVAAYKPEEG
jgi:predicted SAM-dependent methyltransferase